MKYKVANYSVKLPVPKRHRFGRPGAKLDFGMEPVSLGQHRLGEIEADGVSIPLRGHGRHQPETSSHIQDSVSCSDLHFVQQRGNPLCDQRAEAVHVTLGAPGPSLILESRNCFCI
jgi:hypothetical protein